MHALPPSMKLLDRRYKASGRLPVVRVSHEEAEAFCARLSRRSGRDYRLPTEAEWEYACRAGTTTAFAFGSTITREIVNHDGESIRLAAAGATNLPATLPVGSGGVANGFGLFDMHGNVWEWCRDFWHGNYDGAPTDGSGWISDADKRSRVLRGGSWFSVANACRSASRSLSGETSVRSREIGFRVAMTTAS
jgi:formylglycine-generating enzyme required for sulfatase activity